MPIQYLIKKTKFKKLKPMVKTLQIDFNKHKKILKGYVRV